MADSFVINKADPFTRQQIATLLVGRCTNCFRTQEPYHSMQFVDGNVGPFCQDCWKILNWPTIQRLKIILALLTEWPPSNVDRGISQLKSFITELEK